MSESYKKMVCRVCHRPLTRHYQFLRELRSPENPEGMEETWDHGAPSSDFPPHDVDPVPAWENPTWMVCDFCCAQPPMWTLGCHDFVTDIGNIVVHANGQGEDSWGCCDRCYDLLERGQMNRLAQIATDFILAKQSWPREEKRRKRPALLREVREMHSRFVANRTYVDGRDEIFPIRADPDARTGAEALDITQSR